MRINAVAKTKALRNFYESAMSIAERIISKEMEENPSFKLPNPASVARVISRNRSSCNDLPTNNVPF